MEPSTATSSARVAANVRAELAARQLTQQQLAQHMGWSEAKTSRLVRGGAAWDLDEAERVAVSFFGMADVTPLLAHRPGVAA